MKWKLVPVEPVEPMLSTFHGTVEIMVYPDEKAASIMNDRKAWSAMLATSPDPTTNEALVERVARAIAGSAFDERDRRMWRSLALVAIRAMGEKT